MSNSLQKPLQTLGVTPWQLILGIACIGSWWATVQPLPGKLEQLNTTVQALSTRVEVQSVLLNSVKELHEDVKENREETRAEIKTLREELSRIYGKLAVSSTATKTEDIFGKLDHPNELSPIK
jgi:hypothetical protein